MKAGRELDAEISRKILGCAPIQTHEYGHRDAWPEGWLVCRCPGNIHSRAEPKSGYGAKIQEVPHYSTEIGAAWEIVNELVTDTSGFSLMRDSFTSQWGVRFKGYADRQFASTAPLAICLAALKAVPPSPGETKREEQ